MKRFPSYENRKDEISQLLAWELDASDDNEGEEVNESDHKTDTKQSDGEDVEEDDTSSTSKCSTSSSCRRHIV